MGPMQSSALHLQLVTKACTLCRVAAKNVEEDNSVVEVYFQAGLDSMAERALIDLADQVSTTALEHCSKFAVSAPPSNVCTCRIRNARTLE